MESKEDFGFFKGYFHAVWISLILWAIFGIIVWLCV